MQMHSKCLLIFSSPLKSLAPAEKQKIFPVNSRTQSVFLSYQVLESETEESQNVRRKCTIIDYSKK
jgi:hypothetical protein